MLDAKPAALESHLLRQYGGEMLDGPASFLVTRDNHLEADEEAHATRWGAALAAALLARG